MKNVHGLNGFFSVDKLTKVSDLIYYNGPFLSHYVHESGDNYLSYWVDCDNTTQRWLVFRVGLSALHAYVNQQYSLLHLLKSLDDGFVYMIDVNEDGVSTEPLIVFVNNLPDDYLPDAESYFNSSFERKSDVESLSLVEKSGLFEIHFSGNDVKYGNMPFDKYTKCLLKIEELRKCCANRFIRNIKNTDTFKQLNPRKKQEKISELLLNTNFQYVYSLAGSVRVLLRPKNLCISYEQTTADDFAKALIKLFKSGFNVDDLREYAAEYGQEALIKFNELIELLQTSNIDLGVSWTNKKQEIQVEQRICSNEKKCILNNLSQSIEETNELVLKGRFYSLNTKSGAFDFETLEDKVKITGKFDSDIIDVIQTLTFERIYEIIIYRKVKKGLTNFHKITDTIIKINEIQ